MKKYKSLEELLAVVWAKWNVTLQLRRFYITRSTLDGTSHATSTDSIKNANNIILSSQNNLKPQSQPSFSYEEWLAEQRRNRNKFGWW